MHVIEHTSTQYMSRADAQCIARCIGLCWKDIEADDRATLRLLKRTRHVFLTGSVHGGWATRRVRLADTSETAWREALEHAL